MSVERFNLFSFSGRMKILHLSWMAFFITFLVWFNLAPLLMAIAHSLSLSNEEIKILLLLNVSMAIPARIIVGMLTDNYGPRKTYSALLLASSIPCILFALSNSFEQAAIARFLLGFVGAGFVVGIRMVSEWFPVNELGTAEGIYGGWGNFGSAVAAFSLPMVALWFGGEEGWRYAIVITGVLCFVFSFIYYYNVSDTPKGSTYFKPKNVGAMEVTSKGDLILLIIMKIPLYAALCVLAWKLSEPDIALLGPSTVIVIYSFLGLLFLYDSNAALKANKAVLTENIPEIHRYKFKQVAVLNILYFATFGSELAVVSMLPLFFADTYTLDPIKAGMVASLYAFMNLMSRPGGGWISDRFGRRSTLLFLTAGLAIGYLVMSGVDSSWPLWSAVVAVMVCSFFVQAGEGAVFAVVPLIKRRLTGQIAGMTGAYGNVGAVVYLTIFTIVEPSSFFLVISVTAVIGFIALLFLEEPRGHMAEVDDQGNVQLINVS